MLTRRSSWLIFFLGFVVLLTALHAPYLTLPFHWDEMGQFVPAALDLYHYGDWVPQHSAQPNVHPPGVMAVLALVWHIFGYSILSARLTMLVIASAGVFLSFLLAIRLARGMSGAPAFPAAMFLIATPLFFSQSMMVLLDMPAMTMTVLALLLFLDERYAICAVATTALVLVKETAITTPLVFAAWLWFREKRRSEALYFLAPAVALGLWLLELHRVTGFWFGNDEFGRFNVSESLGLNHIVYSIGRRLYAMFLADGRFIGAAALFAGWRLLRGKDWTIAVLVAVAQTLVVTVLGGAVLDRYLLPVFPILYAAMAVAALVYSRHVRLISQFAMLTLLVIGWFWNPPVPFPYENNLAVVDFVRLQQDAAHYLEEHAADKRIASVWPFTDAILRPEMGYVQRPLHSIRIEGFDSASIAKLNPNDFDVLVVYMHDWSAEGRLLDVGPIRYLVRTLNGYRPQASSDEIRAKLGFVPVARWTSGGQFIEIYVRAENVRPQP
ncbi:MAG: ArnT family glycosyltransferase [Bryobacteraceae bacterium]